MSGPGMPGHIGQRFLADPEQTDGYFGRAVECCHRGEEFGSDTRSFLELLALPFDSCYQPQVVQYAGTKIRCGEILRTVLMVVSSNSRVPPIFCLTSVIFLWSRFFRDPGQVHFEPGKLLPQLVVDLTGDPRPFLLADVLQVRCQLADLLVGSLQPLFVYFSLRNICP